MSNFSDFEMGNTHFLPWRVSHCSDGFYSSRPHIHSLFTEHRAFIKRWVLCQLPGTRVGEENAKALWPLPSSRGQKATSPHAKTLVIEIRVSS